VLKVKDIKVGQIFLKIGLHQVEVAEEPGRMVQMVLITKEAMVVPV
jgi:hypothetical protein